MSFRERVFDFTTKAIGAPLGLFAPVTAVRYTAKRAFLRSILKGSWGGYTAADRGGTNQQWNPVNRTADAALRMDYQRALARARDLARNNEYVAGALQTFSANVVGAGITPQPTVKKPRGQAGICTSVSIPTDSANHIATRGWK